LAVNEISIIVAVGGRSFVMRLHPRIGLALAALLAGANAAQAFELAPRFAGPARFRSVKPFAHPKIFRRAGVPLFVDRGDSGGVVVIVQQSVGAPAVPADLFSVSSVSDLPVRLGIREPRPSEAAIYVLNEAGGSAARRETAGARIVDASRVETTGAVEGRGARIIHLTVPAGPR
jgi:hypothetical protein